MSRKVRPITHLVTLVAGGDDMAEGHQRRGPTVRALISGALVLVLAAVGGGVAAAAAPSTSLLWRVGGAAVGAALGLVAALRADHGNQRSEARVVALRARDEVLDALVADPASEGSVFDVLLATSTEAAPFRGRKDELASLERWWDDPNQPPAMVVTGPAGSGKTRLVTEFAASRPVPWVSGWLSTGRGGEAVAAIRRCGDPGLILVDDADQRPDVAALLASLNAGRDAGPLVRVILVSRAAGLLSGLAAALDDRSRGMLSGVRELPLGPFGSADDRARWFGEAVRAYARARRVPPPDLPAHLSSYVTDPAEPILSLQAQALLAVLDSEGSRPMRPRANGLPFDQVAAALFAHEQHRWQTLAQRPEFGLTDLTSPVQQHAIAALLLASPADQAQAAATLRRVPELAKASAERRANIARWAADLYPSDPPWPLQIKPDMFAEWFAVTQLTQIPELAGVLRAMTPAQEAALLLLLAQASDNIPQAVQLFATVAAADITRLAEPAVAAALTASTGQWRLDAELAHLIGQATWSEESLHRVEAQLAGRLPQTQAAIAGTLVTNARNEGDVPGLARALDNLGARLDSLGRYPEALAAGEEAVGLWKGLARSYPSQYQETYNRRLAQLRRDLQLDGQESASIWRQLGDDSPDRDQPQNSPPTPNEPDR